MKVLYTRIVCLLIGHRWTARSLLYINNIKYSICLKCGKTKVV